MASTSLQTLAFESNDVRFIPDGDSFWVVGADVLRALEYSVNSDADKIFASIPAEWVCRKPITARHGAVEDTREMLCLSEQGLYFFLGRSDKPKALPYQKWIAGEVVPSIRKTGEYIVETVEKKPHQGTLPTALSDAMLILSVLYEGNQLALAADKIFVREHGYSALKTAEVQLIAPQQQQLYTPTEIGKSIEPPCSAVKVNKYLEAMGWQVRANDKWEATGPGIPYAVYLDTGKAHSDGTPIRQMKWTADTIFAVQAYLREN